MAQPKYTAWEKAQLAGLTARMVARGPGEDARIGDLTRKWNRIEARARRREQEEQK